MLRGGAFKPRTSPFAFKGLGGEALEILAEAREETGLPVVTELLDTQHAEAIAEHADVVQIGARNMQNYALLEVAGKLGKPVAAQARAELVARRAAAGRRLHPQGGQRGRRPLRARDPHLRDRHALHARPRRGAVAEAPHPPAGDRRSLARRGRPAPGRAALARGRGGGRRRDHRRGPPGPRRGAVRRAAGAVRRRTSPTTRATSRRTRRCWASAWPERGQPRCSRRIEKPTTRRSYSRGRADSPPTCPDSGISHRVLGSAAAAKYPRLRSSPVEPLGAAMRSSGRGAILRDELTSGSSGGSYVGEHGDGRLS